MGYLIMKFGGTSVGNAERILNAVDIVKSNLIDETKIVVVLSAVGGVTDLILKTADLALKVNLNGAKKSDLIKDISILKNRHYEIINNLGIEESIIQTELDELEGTLLNLTESSSKVVDLISSFGERISVKIFAEVLNQALSKINYSSKSFNAFDIGMITNDEFCDAQPLKESYVKIKEKLSVIFDANNVVPVITGFIGKNLNDEITTLGRGGSDYTAAILGNSLDADEIQIWTDVNGVLSTDPRIVSNAFTIPEMTFDEAAELAFFGAKVLHPKTMIPAIKKNIPIVVKNTYEPNNPGTKIKTYLSSENSEISKSQKNSSSSVTAISIKKNVKIIRIFSTRMLDAYGFLAKIFEVFAKHKISVDMLATSEVSVSLTVNNNDYNDAIEELSKFGKVEIHDNMNLVCVVGRNLHLNGSIHGQIFSCLESENIQIRMISQGASLINVGFIIDESNGSRAVELLHSRFFE